MSSSHSLSRAIVQRSAKAESERPLRVIAFEADRAATARGLDLRGITLAEAAEHLVVLDVTDHDQLQGVNVVSIPVGQKNHRLYEAAEVRRRSRMLG